jgi:hemolysin activation/secretion protein
MTSKASNKLVNLQRGPTGASRLLFVLIAGAGAASASAQTIPTPGTVLDTVRPAPEAAPAPSKQAPLVLPRAPQQQLDPNAPRTRINTFRIVGNHVISTQKLEELVQPFAGASYNMAGLSKVTDAITDYYRKQGYAVARAVVPAQKIENGVVTLEIIEGKVDKIGVRGNERYSKEFLQRWGHPLVGRVVRVDELEERLLIIDDLPGLTAQAVLTPGHQYGETTVDLTVQEKSIDGEISINNQGRREVGERRVDASINFNNPFGIGDQLTARTSYSEQGLTKMGGLAYSLPLNTQGTRLAASYTGVDYRIGGDLAALNINGESKLGSVTLIHPLLRSLRQNVITTLGLRSFSGTQALSAVPISDSSILVAEAGLAWNRVDDKNNVSAAAARVSSNFRTDQDGVRDNTQRFKFDVDGSHLRHLTNRVDLRLSGGAQISSRTLADAEKFSIGGVNSVRGYATADVRGDRGYYGSVEGRYRTNYARLPSYFSAFADGGYVSRRNAGAGTPFSTTISSLGLGFTFFPTRAVTGELIAAYPLTQLSPSDKRNNGRIWFNLTTRF